MIPFEYDCEFAKLFQPFKADKSKEISAWICCSSILSGTSCYEWKAMVSIQQWTNSSEWQLLSALGEIKKGWG